MAIQTKSVKIIKNFFQNLKKICYTVQVDKNIVLCCPISYDTLFSFYLKPALGIKTILL